MLKEAHLDAVRNSPMGRKLDEEAIHRIASLGNIECWRKDSIVFWEDQEPKGIYLVLSGAVKLVRHRDDGREMLLHLAEPSDVIAEGALFLGYYPASAITTQNTELFLIRKDDVFELLSTTPKFALHVFDSMAGWLDLLVKKIDRLTLDDATARTVRHLLELRQSEGHDTVTLAVKKGDLAQMLNMNQATLSRTLRTLQDDGLITVDNRTFTLHDPERLRKLMLPPLD